MQRQDLTLYVMVDGATMLGAGYAAPLTGVIIITELTGQPGLIVSLMAMTVAMLTVGNRSVNHAQRSGWEASEVDDYKHVAGG